MSGGNRLDLSLERWQIGRAAHYFAYTDEGARRVARAGMAKDRISIVKNSTDVRTEAALVAKAREADGDGRQSNTVIVLGSLDSSKRPDLVIEAAALISRDISDLRILVVGDGALRGMVEQAAHESGARFELFGRLTGAAAAAVAARAALILNPGRVGLVAVDSFALGLPIVTCRDQPHAPEFGYLRPEVDCLVVSPDARSVATAVVGLLRDRSRLAQMQQAASERAVEFGVEEMAARFAAGIDLVLRRSKW